MTDSTNSLASSDVVIAAASFFDRAPPPEYLDEWVQRLSQPEEQVAQDLLSLVIFQLHDEHLALQARGLAEVTLPQPIHVIPHRTNEIVLGLVNIRGQLRICVSAHELLGIGAPEAIELSPESKSEQRMLILHERSEQWVFPVERVLGVTRLPSTELKPVPSTFGKVAAFSQATFTWHGRTVGYLDEARFLAALRSACK